MTVSNVRVYSYQAPTMSTQLPTGAIKMRLVSIQDSVPFYLK